MAFRQGSLGPPGFGSSAGGSSSFQVQTGPDLEEIETEVRTCILVENDRTDLWSHKALGFQTLAGDAKVRLLPSPWPSDALPPPTASLLSIASKKGLLAAAGPNSMVIASTESVRQAFSASSDPGISIKPFTPQLTLSIGMRVSQVAFSADEKYLVISAEAGGGLAVYDVQVLMQGSTIPTFELSTNGTSLRALVPNPTSEKAELFAVVTTKGELMIGNLTTRQFLNGARGQTMKDGVSCVSWSTRGKQLVAGLGNGTCYQMTPEGEGKAELPRPPDLQGDEHGMLTYLAIIDLHLLIVLVSSISWLENNLFLVGHTPTTFDTDTIPATIFHLITRQPSQPPSCTYQKLPELCLPFGLNRSPPHHFVQRLKDFPPNLQDLIVVSSTGSTDVGLFTRSKTALSNGFSAEKVTDVFTTTTMAEDSRRAQLPMTDDLSDTSPIGVALDLSSREQVTRPLPKEEMEQSSTPLPAVMILNNAGVLCSWWIVYADSIRQGTTYPGLVVAGGQPQAQNPASRQVSPVGGAISQAAPTSNPSSFGAPNPFNRASTFAFGMASTPDSASGAFGASASPAPGKPQSPWASSSSATPALGSGTPAFGKPAFGAASTMGGASTPSFGSTGGIGNRVSPWGAPQSRSFTVPESAFGRPSSLGMGVPAANTFGTRSQPEASMPTSTGGFAAFAKAPGFMGAPAQSSGESPFVKPSTESHFVKPSTENLFAKSSTGASFGSSMETDSSFGGTPKKKDEAPSNPFGSDGFTLGSTFKGDGTAGKDEPRSANNASSTFFGSNFGNTLGEAQRAAPTPFTKEEEMDESEGEQDKSSQASSPQRDSFTPAAQPKSPFPNTTPPLYGGLFGTQSQAKDTPAAVQSSIPAISSWVKPTPTATTPQDSPNSYRLWGKPTPISTTPIETPRKPADIPQTTKEIPSSPPIKHEPEEDEPPGIDESIPLPPESTSKASFAAGESSNSSASTSKAGADDAPLPPDFLPSKVKAEPQDIPQMAPPSLPPDDEDSGLDEEDGGLDEEDGGPDEGLDDEGSGVDVAQELSPTTAESSFAGSFGKSSFDQSPLGGMYTKVKPNQPRQDSRTLFGEVGKTAIPYLPPPPPKVQESPRSPSPVRPFPQGDLLRASNARSTSAPGRPAAGARQNKRVPRKTVPVSGLRASAEDEYRETLDRASAERARKAAEEEQSLSDREDEKVREELETEVEGTRTLDEFLAHQDYIGTVDKPGVPGQIERVYRDINSMIDTLGLNARSLKAFVKGHTEMFKQGGRSREDLEDDIDDWCLIEIGDLESVQRSLSNRLEEGRIHDFQDHLSACRELHKEIKRFEAKGKEISKLIEAKAEPEHTEAVRLAPLDQEQSTLQNEIRKQFIQVQKLLAEAEGGIMMLKTALTSQGTRNGKGPAMKKPTIEAVTNTITKMTRMAEKKSGDVDVLETQIRRLRLSSANGMDLAASLSSKTTSQSSQIEKRKGPMLRDLRKSRSRTPETPGASLRESAWSNSSVRKGMNNVTDEEVARYKERAHQRQAVNKTLKEAFLEKGPVVRGLE